MKNSEKGDLYGSESDGTFAMKRRRFTNTALPVFSGAECWFQHFHIVQAIVKSNGWSEETAALQLFAKGEALNVALLLTKEKRESWTGLVSGLSAYYQSPGRLAVLRRRFESAFRRPGLHPATFATELGILAIQGFEDMKERDRDTMIRDKFIAGQRQCALRRQLDGFAQDTPIGEIVDSCRVWESHSDPDRIATVNCESDIGNQPGDSRTRERMESVANVQPKVVDTERQEPVVGNKEDPSVIEVLVNQLLQSTQGEILRKDRPTVMGPVPASERGLPFSTGGMVGEYGQWTVPRKTNEQDISGGAGKRAVVRAGGSASRAAGDQSYTDPGGGFRRNKQRKSNWRIPTENKRGHWAADSQEFPSLETRQRTVGNTKRSAGPSAAEVDRRPTASPTPVLRNLDRGMRPAQDFQPVPQKDSNTWTQGVQKTIVTPLSALAENFIPRKTSRKPPTPQVPTDNELDRSFARTGPGKIETPQDIIEIDIATVGAAYPTGISKPVAMADVAGASGPAVTGADGPVVAGTRLLAVAEAYAPFEEAEGDPQGDDRKVDQKFSTPEEDAGSHR